MSKQRSPKGFTLVETLVCVVVIGILTAITLPNLVSAQDRARTATVRSNMHTVGIAAESYAIDSGGVYGATGGDLDPYFLNGSSTLGGTAGVRPTNPYSRIPDQPLYAETLTTSALVISARSKTPTAGPGLPGQVGYCQSDGGQSYAVCGLDANGIRIGGPNSTTLVLSHL